MFVFVSASGTTAVGFGDNFDTGLRDEGLAVGEEDATTNEPERLDGFIARADDVRSLTFETVTVNN